MLSKFAENRRHLVQHFTDAGQLIGYSEINRKRNPTDAVCHYDTDGKLVGYSRQAGYLSSKVLQHFDVAGQKLGYSKWGKNSLVHFNSRGKEIGNSQEREKQGFLRSMLPGCNGDTVHTNTDLPIPFLVSRIYNVCYDQPDRS